MKKVTLLCVVFLLFAFNYTALAQDEVEEKDLLEANFYGGMGIPAGGIGDWHDSLGAKTGFSMGAEIGYYVKPNITLGLSFAYTQFGIDAKDDADKLHHRLYTPSIYAKYYFETNSNFLPYVKVHMGVENPKFTTFVGNLGGDRYREKSYDPSFAYGIGAGVFYYTADFSGIFLELNYHRAATKDSEAEYGGQKVKFGENLGLLDIHAGVRILVSGGGK
jgi:opacity protein-like surface antigen